MASPAQILAGDAVGMVVDVVAKLRADDDLVAMLAQRFVQDRFCVAAVVGVCRVEERDTSFVGGSNDLDALGLIYARAVVAAAEAHVAEAEFRDFQGA